ncbi:MAG TPA: hypothetical protein VKG82_10360 [Solirubrobacteraceae bacterium]|nr:hypothetical protein [Solirubrobacteraceae bacterium]
MIAALLIVTVFSVGGPPGTPRLPFPGVTVNATYPSGRMTTLKTDRRGRAYVRFAPPGTYRLQAELRPPISMPAPRPCESRSVRARGPVTRVRLYCQIR